MSSTNFKKRARPEHSSQTQAKQGTEASGHFGAKRRKTSSTGDKYDYTTLKPSSAVKGSPGPSGAAAPSKDAPVTDTQVLAWALTRKNLKYYNQLIAESAKRKNISTAFKLFEQLKGQKLKPDSYTFSSLVNVCVRSWNMPEAEKLVQSMASSNVVPNVVTYTSLVKGYVQERNLARAVEVLRADMKLHKVHPNVRTYNTILRGCFRDGASDLAAELFKEMKASSIVPDKFSLESLLRCRVQAGQLDHAFTLLPQLEALAGNEMDAGICLVMASMCTILGRKVAQTQELVDKFDKAAKATQAGPGAEEMQVDSNTPNDGEGEAEPTKRRGLKKGERIAALELLAERDLIASALAKKQSGQWVPLQSQSIVAKGPRGSPFVFFDDVHPPQADVSEANKLAKFAEYFRANKDKRKKLEICAGGGDWLLQRASQSAVDSPHDLWFALERRFDRVHEIWRKVILKGLGNVNILAGDANAFLGGIPLNSLDEAYIHFPEPPQSEDNLDRLIDEKLLQKVLTILKPNATLSIVTDDESYSRMILDDLKRIPSLHIPTGDAKLTAGQGFLSTLPDGYGSSFFDQLWKERGRGSRFLIRRVKKTLKPT